jgi:hypothetical protein
MVRQSDAGKTLHCKGKKGPPSIPDRRSWNLRVTVMEPFSLSGPMTFPATRLVCRPSALIQDMIFEWRSHPMTTSTLRP